MAINNTVPNQGLMSTNPFLNTNGLKTGGSTTPATGGTTGGNIAGVTYGSGVSTPVPSGVNLSGLLKPPSTTSSSTGSLQPYLAGAGQTQTSAIPAGYSYDAQGRLTNSSGQLYQAPQTNSSALNSGTLSNGILPAGQDALRGTMPGVGLIPLNQNPYSAQAPTFGGLVGGLAGTASQQTPAYTRGQETASQAATALMGSAPQQSAAVQEQAQRIRDLQTAEANAVGQTNNRPGISLQQASGETGLLENLYASKLNAEQTGLQNVLQGNAQQQAAFTGAGNLANTSAGLGTSQQGTQQSGLAAAGGLAQPSYLAPGQSPYSPTTGEYGQIAGTQSGAGGLQGIGNISGQIGIGQDVAQQNAILGSAQATGDALQTLITQNNINPSAFTPLNGALQIAAKYKSNSAYQQFAGQVNDFVSKIAPILGGPGGATTDYKTQLAGSIINSVASGKSIKDVISYFLAQAQRNIQGYSQGGGVGVGQTNATGNSIYNF